MAWIKKWKNDVSCGDYQKMSMLKKIQILAGLGNPPGKWTNMRNEAINKVIEEDINWERKDQAEIHEELQKLVHRQYSEFTKAIYGIGEYRLATDLKHLQVDPVTWTQMTKEQRVSKINSVFKTKNIAPEEDSLEVIKHLSISVQESQVKDIGQWKLQRLWSQAEVILSNFNIIPFSASQNRVCVMDEVDAFTVTFNEKSGKFKCNEKCTNYKAHGGLCQHSLAAAEKMTLLAEFISWYNAKKEKSTANSIINEAIPIAAGKKASVRKGKNNKISHPVLTVSDEIGIDNPVPFNYNRKEYYHNDQSFHVVFLKDHGDAVCCNSCNNEFPRRFMIAPFNIVLSHKERYKYPDKNGQWVPTFRRECPKY